MTREALHDGWQRAWKRFYSPSAIWNRWTVRARSSWIQTLGYLPLNVMQNRLVKHKILGKKPRFRSSSDFDPMSFAMNAIADVDGAGQTSGAASRPSASLAEQPAERVGATGAASPPHPAGVDSGARTAAVRVKSLPIVGD
jgi:hypothetical protein